MQGHTNDGTEEKNTGFPLTTGGKDRGGAGGMTGVTGGKDRPPWWHDRGPEQGRQGDRQA